MSDTKLESIEGNMSVVQGKLTICAEESKAKSNIAEHR